MTARAHRSNFSRFQRWIDSLGGDNIPRHQLFSFSLRQLFLSSRKSADLPQVARFLSCLCHL